MPVVLSIKAGRNTLETNNPIVPVLLINDAAVVYLCQNSYLAFINAFNILSLYFHLNLINYLRNTINYRNIWAFVKQKFLNIFILAFIDISSSDEVN